MPRKSACGHDCEECAGCGMTGAAIKARAKNDPVGAQPGEKVVVREQHQKAAGRGGAGVCAAGGVLSCSGYFLSEGLAEGWRYGIAIAAAALAFVPSVIYDRYARRQGAADLPHPAGVLRDVRLCAPF